MRIDIEIDTQAYDRQVDLYLDGVVRPAIASGLNAAADLIKEDLVEAAGRDFDRPNPFTLRGFDVLPARVDDPRDLSALVSIRPLQAAYLEVQIDGGVRRAGDAVTTAQGPLVPGPDAKLNRYGNLPRGYVARELAKPDVFWTTLGVSDKPALVRRTQTGLEILALIVEETRYDKKFDFFGIVEAGANQHIAIEVGRALGAATRSTSED
jgi:hypothetical protein